MENKIIKVIPQNFIYPEIKETDYVFGSGQVIGNILRPDGDWRPYLPPAEEQRRNGIESSSCFIEASQHSIATILEEQFGILDQNFSARFNFIFASPILSGGDPLKGAQTFRDYGLIPNDMLPFSDEIKSWEEFKSFKGGDENLCLKTGKEWLITWEPRYDIAVKREMDVKIKYNILKEVLKNCPPPVSVYGVTENDVYIKPAGVNDTHLVELVYIDENNCPYIWDTYPPFLKKLEPFYNFDFGLRWTLPKKNLPPDTPEVRGILQRLLSLFQQVINLWSKKKPEDSIIKPMPPAVPPADVTQETLPPKPLFKGDTVIDTSKDLPDALINCLLWAETRSSLDHLPFSALNAIGDTYLKDKAYGCLQIRLPVIQDINRRYKLNYKPTDLLGNLDLSVKICTLYLRMWADKAHLKREPTMQDCLRIWNAGPSGFWKPSSIPYWNDIKEHFNL